MIKHNRRYIRHKYVVVLTLSYPFYYLFLSMTTPTLCTLSVAASRRHCYLWSVRNNPVVLYARQYTIFRCHDPALDTLGQDTSLSETYFVGVQKRIHWRRSCCSSRWDAVSVLLPNMNSLILPHLYLFHNNFLASLLTSSYDAVPIIMWSIFFPPVSCLSYKSLMLLS